MKCLQLCIVIAGIAGLFAEPFIFSTLMSIGKVTDSGDSLMNNLQKIKVKTDAINERLEKIAPAGILGNCASKAIHSTTNTTASVMNSASQVIDVTAKDMVTWAKNTSFTCFEKGSELVLRKFQEYAVSHNMDNMTLPPIDTKISGVHVTATGGFFSSFSSLVMAKRINVTNEGENGLSIRIPLSLRVLDTGYSKFTAKLLFLSISGKLGIQIQKNEIDVLLRFKATNSCALNVDRVEVVTMDGISIQIQSGCKTCSSIISRMSSGLANFMKKTLVKMVQENIDGGIQNVLKTDSLICAHFIKPS